MRYTKVKFNLCKQISVSLTVRTSRKGDVGEMGDMKSGDKIADNGGDSVWGDITDEPGEKKGSEFAAEDVGLKKDHVGAEAARSGTLITGT